MAIGVFLDRDGVLIETDVRDGRPYAVGSVGALALLPGVHGAVDALHRAGLVTVVVTNQPDIANGLIDQATVEGMHDWLRARLPLDDVLTCPHTDADDCACRKPKPGMLLDAARRFGIDLHDSFLVGDRWRDIDAGRNAGCTTIWIDRGYDERRGDHADFTVPDLAAAASVILERLVEDKPRRHRT